MEHHKRTSSLLDFTRHALLGMSGGILTEDELRSAMPRVKSGRKGTRDRHIIKTYVKDGREYSLHATKGWRSRRV